MWSLYPSVEGTTYLAYVFHNWFSCSSFAGLDHVQEPCSAMDCWNGAWISWVRKMGVSSGVGDSILIFLQEFDSRVGVIHLLSSLRWGVCMQLHFLHLLLIDTPVVLQPRWAFKRLIALNYTNHSAYYGSVKLVIWPMYPSFCWPEVPLSLHI